jgi:polysaccharide export outer membrane protein
MKLIRTFLLLAFPLYLISCSTQQKLPNYLENLTDTSGKEEVKIPEMRIQKNDLLSIMVYSSSTMPSRSDAIYNLPSLSSPATPSQQGGGSGNSGFLVDAYGNIEYPHIGVLHAEGLTKQELAEIIKKRINQPDSVLTNPSVIIRFQNLKVTVLGEVKSPGVINFPGERLTVLEAIGLAGDFTDFGLKNTVKVVREVNGKRESGFIDVSSMDVFNSPYYNLQQNDVVLVEPSKRKAKKAEQDVVMRQVSFGLSIITAIALLYNVFN